MIRDLWGMGIMKKTIVLTMLVLLMFVAGCGPVPWKDFYQSHAENIIGLECVYYRNGRLTFKFDEKYAKTDDDGYRDSIGLIRNGNQQDKAQVSACVITGEDVIFPEGKAVLTVPVLRSALMPKILKKRSHSC